MTDLEAIVGIVMGVASLLVVFGIGLRWMLSTWNRSDEGEDETPRLL
jgi:hypothetical protein